MLAHERAAEGGPVVLVSQGVVNERALRREAIDENELEQAVREHGVAELEDVEMAVLEVDGSISVVPRDRDVIRTRRHFRQVRKQN